MNLTHRNIVCSIIDFISGAVAAAIANTVTE
jgi:hypothetical protein